MLRFLGEPPFFFESGLERETRWRGSSEFVAKSSNGLLTTRVNDGIWRKRDTCGKRKRLIPGDSDPKNPRIPAANKSSKKKCFLKKFDGVWKANKRNFPVAFAHSKLVKDG